MAGSKVTVKINYKGVHEVLVSPGLMADLQRRATAVAQAAGPGHRIEATPGGVTMVGPQRGAGGRFIRGSGNWRGRVAVITSDAKSRWKEAHRKALTQAVSAAR